MPYGYSTDAEIDDSTDRMMLVGVALFIVLIAAFPLYLLYELGILMSKLFVRQRSSKPDEAVAAED